MRSHKFLRLMFNKVTSLNSHIFIFWEIDSSNYVKNCKFWSKYTRNFRGKEKIQDSIFYFYTIQNCISTISYILYTSIVVYCIQVQCTIPYRMYIVLSSTPWIEQCNEKSNILALISVSWETVAWILWVKVKPQTTVDLEESSMFDGAVIKAEFKIMD
jgi:hypothetical protein